MGERRIPGGHEVRTRRLRRVLRELGGAAVACSGGVDSSVLLHAAHDVLGDRAVGVIADSPSLPRAELADAVRFAASIGARLEVVATRELQDPRYRANAGDRCYFCKEALFDALAFVARRESLPFLVYGEIEGDVAEDRPGSRSAKERGVRAPLREAGCTKDDVRRYARARRLDVWDKPASACLASRLPVGTKVSAARLARVERAEAGLRELGLQVLRVRDHGRRARLEVGADERPRSEQLRARIGEVLAAEGFLELELATYVDPAERLRGVSASRSGAAPPAAPGTGS